MKRAANPVNLEENGSYQGNAQKPESMHQVSINSGKTLRSATEGATPKRKRTPTAQDGALGAGSTSALVVLVNYVTAKLGWQNVPAEIIAYIAPFASLGLTYVVAGIKEYNRVRNHNRDKKEFEREIQTLLDKGELPPEIANEYKARLEELKRLSLEQMWQKIYERHEESISSASIGRN